MAFTFDELISYIENANDHEIYDIISAVSRRFRSQYPDWEVIFLSCPKKASEERDRIMAYIQNHFRQEKECVFREGQ